MDGLSIITPTRGRVELVRGLLRSIADDALNLEVPYEVLVVDDTDAPLDAVQRATCERFGARYVRGPRRVGQKRNVAARAASYELLVFIDSDCEAMPGLLKAHLDAHRTSAPDVVAVAGPTMMMPDDGNRIWALTHRTAEFNVSFDFPRDYEELLWATTSNLSVTREAFERVGGFRGDTLTVVGGEDVDLGVKLCESGYRILCSLDARVVHSRRQVRSPWDIVSRLFTYGRSSAWLCKVHPHRRVWRRNPIALTLVVAMAAGLLRGRRMRRAVAAAATVFLVQWAKTTGERLQPMDSRTEIVNTGIGVVLDWSFDAGEVLGTLQLGRVQNLFRRFLFLDPERCIPRQQEALADFLAFEERFQQDLLGGQEAREVMTL